MEFLADYLEKVNRWRRGDDYEEEPEPCVYGLALDCAIEFLYREAAIREAQE